MDDRRPLRHFVADWGERFCSETIHPKPSNTAIATSGLKAVGGWPCSRPDNGCDLDLSCAFYVHAAFENAGWRV
jgi:hypothetical protein